eukprot:CCRYP_012655-RB/>CCRYP_012655-RB protein AED:0.03 eAED:0.03 QI:227/1/1/1/0.5/0.33/3/572/193
MKVLISSSLAISILTLETIPSCWSFSPTARHCKVATKPAQSFQMSLVDNIEPKGAVGDISPTKKSCEVITSKPKSRRLYTFDEARTIARGHGFDSKQEFLEYTCPGAYQIPKDADVVWKDDWRGWDDFLGIPLSFEEGRQVARALVGIDSEEKYLNLMKSKTIPDNDAASRLPFRPDLKYKTDWLGWDDFLIG